jgi:hypothetical protein
VISAIVFAHLPLDADARARIRIARPLQEVVSLRNIFLAALSGKISVVRASIMSQIGFIVSEEQPRPLLKDSCLISSMILFRFILFFINKGNYLYSKAEILERIISMIKVLIESQISIKKRSEVSCYILHDAKRRFHLKS